MFGKNHQLKNHIRNQNLRYEVEDRVYSEASPSTWEESWLGIWAEVFNFHGRWTRQVILDLISNVIIKERK